MEALIVVDVQNDFCAGGALPVPDGDSVVGPINQLLDRYDFVVATRDWHPPNHHSFDIEGGPWPPHCVQNTSGAALHPDLNQAQINEIVDVGAKPEDEGYSGFEQSNLEQILRDNNVQKVRVCGLALDYCVKATALDAVRAGFDVTVDLNATRAINVTPGDDQRSIEELEQAGAEVIA